MSNEKPSRWLNRDKIDPATLWRSKPIPFGMALRGYLPKFLGGEMVYDAVVRVNHFGSTPLLVDYLMEQLRVAGWQGADFHYNAIEAHLDRIVQAAKDARKAEQQKKTNLS